MVRVVVRERTDGAGDEKVLSPPLRESRPPLMVRLVPAIEDSRFERAVVERAVCSVEMVGAMDRPPVVVGAWPSVDSRADSVVGARDVTLEDLAEFPVMTESWLCRDGACWPGPVDWRYGLLFCALCFLVAVLVACRPPSPDEAPLRFASFFIRAEKGRRRPGRLPRSAMVSAVPMKPSGGAELRRLRKVEEKCGMAEAGTEAALGRVMGGRRADTHTQDGGRAGETSTYHGVEMWFQSWPWQAQRSKVSATGDEHHLVQVLLGANQSPGQ